MLGFGDLGCRRWGNSNELSDYRRVREGAVGGGAVVALLQPQMTSGRWAGMKGAVEEEDHRAKGVEEEEDRHEEEDHRAKGAEEEDCRNEEARGRTIG
jgi:predicted rRNA methylase YqxC with S4 and FtsJ domains